MTDKRPGFQPGQSGNPAGRPKGSRSKAMQALDAIFDGEAEAITNKVIELAKDGDTQALRMCLDRLVPPRRDRPVTFELPQSRRRQTSHGRPMPCCRPWRLGS
jgi:hypothetical protein